MKNLHDLYTKSAEPWPLWAAPIALFMAVACWLALENLENDFFSWSFFGFFLMIFLGSLLKSIYFALFFNSNKCAEEPAPESTNP